MSRRIDYYFSMQSPWAYIGHSAFQDVVRTHGCSVRYKPVFLGELFAETGGLPLAKRHPARQRYRMLELQRWRDKRGLHFHLSPRFWPFNGRLADGLVIAMIEAGRDPEPFLRAGFPAVWEQQRDLADPATLIDIATQAGFDGETLVARAGTDAVGAIYERHRDEAISANVFGAPVYVLDDEVFWGQDRIELLADALKSGREPYRAKV